MRLHVPSRRAISTALALGLLSTAGGCSSSSNDSDEPPETDAAARVDAAAHPRVDASTPSGNHDAAAADTASDASEPPTADASASSDASEPPTTSTDPSASDSINGQQVPRANSWWTDSGRIYYGDQEVRLFGLNWFGLEGDSRALFGPAQANRTVADFLAQIKGLGFNALRVPLSPESIDPGFASASWANVGSIDTGREQFEALASAARDAGVYMLWDIHTCSSAVGYMKTGPLDPACTGYGKDKWLDNLKTLATLAKNYAPYVLGIDLFNEPYGLSWSDWKALAEAGGQQVLQANPNILTFVEGVGAQGYAGPDAVFWGENLTGAQAAPIALPASRLVYEPHVYGPSVYAQPYFSDASFPTNMPALWDKHFGYLFGGAQPLVVGEFGGHYTDSDKTWQDAFVAYLKQKGARSFFYWALNPNSGDTGGILEDDWKTVVQPKVTLLQMLMK